MCLIKHPSKVLSRLNQHGRRVRTTLTCFAISLGYLICWLPIFIYKKKSELRKLFDQIKLSIRNQNFWPRTVRVPSYKSF